MEDKDTMMANEPAVATRSKGVRQTGLLSQVMRMSVSDKKALIAYLQKDINQEVPFKTDDAGRIILNSNMREAASMAQRDLEAGKCFSEESFKQRFAKWL